MDSNNFSSSTKMETATAYSVLSSYQPWFYLFNTQPFEAVPVSISGYFENQVLTSESPSINNISSINNTFTQPIISFSNPWLLAPTSLVTQMPIMSPSYDEQSLRNLQNSYPAIIYNTPDQPSASTTITTANNPIEPFVRNPSFIEKNRPAEESLDLSITSISKKVSSSRSEKVVIEEKPEAVTAGRLHEMKSISITKSEVIGFPPLIVHTDSNSSNCAEISRSRTHSEAPRRKKVDLLKQTVEVSPPLKIQDPCKSTPMFKCSKCLRSFNRKSSWKRHEFQHTGQRPHKCKYCDASFKLKHHLQEHIRKHTNEKPFQCLKCLKTFSHSGSYSHHRNKRFPHCLEQATSSTASNRCCQ